MIGVSTDLTGQALRTQFNAIMEKQNTWLESGNKSGKEGDLDEAQELLKQIMFDLEAQEVAKKKKEELAKDLNLKEGAITSGQVQDAIIEKAKQSKRKRKEMGTDDTSSASLTSSNSSKTPSPSEAFASLDDFIFGPSCKYLLI
jgi:hypothetical protein